VPDAEVQLANENTRKVYHSRVYEPAKGLLVKDMVDGGKGPFFHMRRSIPGAKSVSPSTERSPKKKANTLVQSKQGKTKLEGSITLFFVPKGKEGVEKKKGKSWVGGQETFVFF